ncbi:phosphoenolpyruvate synthase [Brevibacterium daeguense]|uniref:Phosphoenolpyruvate synthase n=1 Tax=Brevibacterium daeguense TaxID=909936 RepID=A0ABP8EJT4_9MICO|nr:PEP/pyruvate-binding domain-containing protein [Brevibacterium daeguense]
MDVIDLARIPPGRTDLVGGKAAGLAGLISAGERVPDGFCLTTEAHRAGIIPEAAVVAAYRRLGSPPVAVRSSATAEDLPDASFAGQQDTFLDVTGEDELIDAIRRCWRSLDSDRAVAYRAAHSADAEPPSMAVVVQRMIAPAAAGVMFTANPLTGTRTETVVDAVEGLGTGVVDGTVDPDHYVLPERGPVPAYGCLSPDELRRLRATGLRVQRIFDRPQDVEWALDAERTLWLLQSRAITTLFPLPPARDDLRVYLEVGHVQGLRRPLTPMGMSVLREVSGRWLNLVGADDAVLDSLLVDIGGRMFMDLTGFLHSRRLRGRVPEIVRVYGPAIARSAAKLLDDPRFAPRPGGHLFSRRAASRLLLTSVPKALVGALWALARPSRARERAFRELDRVRSEPTADPPDTSSRIRAAVSVQDPALTGPMMRSLPPLWAALLAQNVANGLLTGIIRPGELNAVLRGMPHNVTTQMDLELWSVARAAAPHRELLISTAPEELAARFRQGLLPEFGLTAFLAEYGIRGTAEIDVGAPRWAEDPAPVFAALAGYLLVTDPDQAPSARFARAAAEAEASLRELIGRAERVRPLRAWIVGSLLHRTRELAGLRELPKFLWLTPISEARRQLLAAGAELTAAGLLDAPGDIMFLTLTEAVAAAQGADQRTLVSDRRREHQREARRRQIPGLLLSDGTNPLTLPDAAPSEHGPDILVGVPAATGSATGPVRIVHQPSEARLRPGDILVAATTDPGWTPLFLTIGGLITETGSPIAHGPTVAREYGIPAVVSVPEVTTRLTEGQTVTLDGATGVIRMHTAEGERPEQPSAAVRVG